MQITGVKIYPVIDREDVLAYAAIDIIDCIDIHGLALRRGKDAYFIAMPLV